jgi:hypothetical protein
VAGVLAGARPPARRGWVVELAGRARGGANGTEHEVSDIVGSVGLVTVAC